MEIGVGPETNYMLTVPPPTHTQPQFLFSNNLIFTCALAVPLQQQYHNIEKCSPYFVSILMHV